MKFQCKRCGKPTEFEKIKTVTKAGDSGFVRGEGYKCKECGFVPLFLEEVKEKEEGEQIDLCDIC